MPLWVLKLVAGARFVGAWLDVRSALLLVLCSAVLLFVPIGMLSAQIVVRLPLLHVPTLHEMRQRPLITLRLAALFARGMLAGVIAIPACVAAWLLAAVLAQSPPWLMVALPALIGAIFGVVVHRSWKGLVVFVVSVMCVFLALWCTLLDGAPAASQVASQVASQAAGNAAVPAVTQGVDVKALFVRLQAGNPLRMSTEQRAVLAFTPDELAAVLRWLTQRVDPNATVRVASDHGQHALAWQLSVALPVPYRSYLNASGTTAVRLSGAAPVMPVCSFAIGAVRVRGWLCEQLLLGWYPSRGIAQDALAAPADLLHAVAHLDQLRVDEHGVGVAYRRVAMDDATRRVLQQLLGPGDAVTAAVAAQLLYIQQDLARLQRAPDRFQAVLQNAFRLAQVRSRVGDPVSENQGAILALAIMFGSEEIAAAAGMPRPQNVAETAARIGPLTLLGREDWVKHFLVSAALVQVATAGVSDVAGRVKEQLDARGGSGFSFADLLADRAGARFGEVLSADADTAAKVQHRLVSRYELAAFFPLKSALPEGMQQGQFQSDFGAVGSPQYLAVEAEIARQLAGCDLYR